MRCAHTRMFDSLELTRFFRTLWCTVFQRGGEKYLPGRGPPVGEKCPHCEGTMHIGGPVWGGAIHDKDFIATTLSAVEEHPELYGTSKRMIGHLSVLKEVSC